MKGTLLRTMLAAIGAVLTLIAPALGAPSPEDTSRQFFDDEMSTLLVGEQSVAVFPAPSTLPLKRGVAVLFYEPGSLGLTFDVAAQVGNRLNEHGWDTLLVPAMFSANTSLSETSDNEQDAVQPRTDSLSPAIGYTDSRATFSLLLNAVYQHIADKEGFRMVIAQGMTAALLLDTGSNDAITVPDTAVVLSPFWPKREHNQSIPAHLADTTFPVLDIGLNDYNNWALSTRFKRSQEARTSLKLHYRQQVMLSLGTAAIARSVSYSGRQLSHAIPSASSPATASSMSPFATRLAGRIHGWTTYLGW